MTRSEFAKMISIHGNGTKLEDFRSLSTSPLLNPLCVGRHGNKMLICASCYSYTYNKMRKGLREKLARNTAILSSGIIPYELIPVINDRYFRIESFGDLQNVIQAINYLNFICKNPETSFGWWTKNPAFIRSALAELGIEKPSNVQVIFSACGLNVEISIETVQKAFPFVDKVFTVFDSDYIDKHDIAINCGDRKCAECLNCYKCGGNAQVREKRK